MKRTILILATLFLMFVTGNLLAQSAQPVGEAFSWHAELVALDENMKTITVKSRVVGDQAPTEFGRLKPNDKVVLIWSGFDKYADAIRAVRLYDAKKAEERLTFPVDFVSFDAAQNYVTFKVQIPASAVAKLKSIKPGEWVTAASPHGPSSYAQPIVMIRHYNEPAAPSSN